MRRRPPRLAAAPPWCFMLGRRGALREAEKDGEEVERKVGERKDGEEVRVGSELVEMLDGRKGIG